MPEQPLLTPSRSSEYYTNKKPHRSGNAKLIDRRHLLRLWLRDPEYEWRKPKDLQERFDRVYAGVTIESSVFPLEATIRSSNVAT